MRDLQVTRDEVIPPTRCHWPLALSTNTSNFKITFNCYTTKSNRPRMAWLLSRGSETYEIGTKQCCATGLSTLRAIPDGAFGALFFQVIRMLFGVVVEDDVV